VPLDWYRMDLAEQAESIIDMIDGLTDQDIENTYNEWSKLRYEKSLNGQTKALSDLQQIATRYLLKRLGMWDSYVQRVTSRKDKI